MPATHTLDSWSVSVAQVVPATEAEGPGRRFALWVQGCPLRCPGCCNPEMLSVAGGQLVTVADLVAQVDAARRAHAIEGITLLGGEPTAHARPLAMLARAVQGLGLSVMLFSGFTLEELQARHDPDTDALLACSDILVDGPYRRDQPETRRRWVGSANQRVHFLSGRYRADDPRWGLPNTLEIRLVGGELTVNGFPARPSAGLWRRPARRS